MTYDPNYSPVGWYVGSYLLRFVEIGAAGNYSPRRRFLSWENTVLVKARSFDEAYAKVTRIGRASSRPYRGGPKAIRVRWIFEGVTDVLPVYERITDGVEIMWTQRSPRTLKALRALVRTKRALRRSGDAA